MAYKEYMIKRKKGVKEYLLSILIIIAAIVLALATMIFVRSLAGFDLLIAVGFLYGGYWLTTKFNKEFEYIITEDCVDVDVIYNASRRKRLVSFSMKEAQIIAPITNDEYKTYASNEEYKVVDATTGRKGATVYFAAVDKKGKHLLKFEPPVTALQELRKFAPSKVVIE